jgi:RNA polymerase-associated protein LEO1
MPNFVKMDTKPFHPETYLGPEEEESMQAESLREKSMTIKLKVENTVRWRWIKDAGVDVGILCLRNSDHRSTLTGFVIQQRQSNSRVIRWSDGTMSLLLGKELFDITQSIDTSAGVPRQVAGSSISQSHSQPSQSQSQTSGLKSQGLTYLVAQHKRSQVLQSEAVVTGYLSLRPTGMQSETHRMLVRAVGQKHSKVARLRMAPDPTMDPERGLKELAKQSAKKSRRKNEVDDLGGGRRRRQSRRAADTGALWSSDEDVGGDYDNYDDEDEDGGAGSSASKGKRKASGEKKLGEDYQEDDFVVADSSDEEGVSRKKRAKHTSDGEDDPLDRLEAKIEEQDSKKRKKTTNSGDASDETDEDGMDVESEEGDEDDFKVRRVGGGRKRTHISMDDDEE